MTWVNSPPCVNPNCVGNEDGKLMKSEGVRGPLTEEEREGGAGRVESEYFVFVVSGLYCVHVDLVSCSSTCY